MSYNNGKKFEGNNKGGYNKGGNRNNNKKFLSWFPASLTGAMSTMQTPQTPWYPSWLRLAASRS